MARKDEIDPALAKHFAWSFVPGHRPDLAAAKVEEAVRALDAARRADTGGPGQAGSPEFETRARAACRPLAAAIAEAWACREEEARARLTKRLLVRAERLGVSLAGMKEWPEQAVRLLRLAVALGPRATRRQRSRAASVASLMPLDHPETADLLVEIARATEWGLAAAIFSDDDWNPDVFDPAGLVVRLADVVDEAPSYSSRALAIEILRRFEERGLAAPALKRALRLPNFAVRARAVDALVSAEPCALTAEDLIYVLRDLVAHALPEALDGEEREQDETLFGDAVIAALESLAPEEAAEALLDFIDAEHDSLLLDAGWATEALAVGFPETGAVMVDHWLKCARSADRFKAVAALERLPLPMAEARVRLAASDPSHLVREAARRVWIERMGKPLGDGIACLVGASLLPEPPSDRFVARLQVLHGRLTQARSAMARALLEEAPDREALVLLLQLVGDDVESREPVFGTGEGWAVTLVARFGALGVAGLRALAERFPEPESYGWMRRIGDLVEKGHVPGEHSGDLRELAASHVLSEDAGQVDDALRVLTLVGAPPALLDRVLSLALSDEIGAWEARKLVAAWPERTVDARLVSDMAMALADRDWDRVKHAAWMSLERGVGAASVVAQRVLEVAEETEEALDAGVVCAQGLRDRGLLDEAWAMAAVARPDAPCFAIAARVWKDRPAVRARLEAALGSEARGGASAAVAAIVLVATDPRLTARDRRLRAVLRAAPPPERAELLLQMCVHGAPFSVLAESLESLITSTDERVTSMLVGIPGWLRSPKAHALFRRLLPAVVDPELRADIEQHLGETPEPYWA
jgi:hypothetical protein